MEPDPARRSVWKRGERAARRYLRRRGYRTLGTNVRTAAGEADLVMLAPDRRTVVLVEVKARVVAPHAQNKAGDVAGVQRRPEASITEAKRRRLRGIAKVLARRRVWQGRPIRIDVVAVEFVAGRPTIRHYEHAL
ncbi:MAG: YraN family protein [Planctomycetota bacterium]